MKFSVITLGCTLNRAEGEIMKNILIKKGYQYTENPDESEILIINTCTVKGPSESKAIKLVNKYKDKKLILAGCLVQHQPELFKGYPLIGLDHIEEVDKVLEDYSNGKIDELIDRKNINKLLPSVDQYPIKIIILQEGCLWNCLYCATKLARGNAKSYPPEYIYKEVRDAKLKGLKIIYFTGTDLATYGYDLNIDLADLLFGLKDIKGEYYVRVGMANPGILNKFIDKLLDSYDNENIFKFFHIPVQSGSNSVLKTMGRGYIIEDFYELVEKIRKRYYEGTIATDIIVGYPTETEEDFEKTLDLLKTLNPDVVNISRFFPRPKTSAEKLKQLPMKIVNDRSRKIHELVREISLEKNKKYLQKIFDIFVDEIGKEKSYIGRTMNYRPVVIESESDILGKFINVEITNVKSNFLIGKIKI